MLKPGQTRFLLAFIVILYHLSKSIFLGHFAVGCFFVLSGYWIAAMYETKYSKKHQSIRVFYVSRIWRLLPVFYTFTILGFLSYVIFHSDFLHVMDSLNIFDKILMLISNIFILGYSNNRFNLLVPAWSLDIELQFYILFPLIAYIIKKHKKLIIYLIIFFIIIPAVLFALNQVWITHTLLYYLYLFLIGVFVREYDLRPSNNIKNISLIIFIGIVAIQFIVPLFRNYVRDNDSIYLALLNFFMILAAIPAIISSVYMKTNKSDKFWGEMSFIIYLSHWVWLTPYNDLIAHGGKFERVPYVLGFLIITFLSSYAVYKFIDRPLERFRHNWINQQSPKHTLD